MSALRIIGKRVEKAWGNRCGREMGEEFVKTIG
jgi:hypothetical protein